MLTTSCSIQSVRELTMLLRPLSSLSRSLYEERTQTLHCGAQDTEDTTCHNQVVGHLWPSDYSFIRWIKTVRNSRKQSFPSLNSMLVCEGHYQFFSRALNAYDSNKVAHGQSLVITHTEVDAYNQ